MTKWEVFSTWKASSFGTTPSGKATMFVTHLPQLVLPQHTDFGLPESTSGVVVALMTGGSYSQHNTVVYKNGDRYRGMPYRNCILMNRADAQKANLQEHQRVTVQGNAGKMENVEVIYGAVRQGAALMFYPEVNAIFNPRIEKRSGTPAYKRVPVCVYGSV